MTDAQGPIFVVGSYRSGTTLMRLMLDAHPRIAIPEETGIMRAVAAQRRIPFWKLGDGWFERLGSDEQAFDRSLAAFYGSMFERFAASHGKQRWGEKTPWHLWHVDAIRALWPDAVFVGMVRHPGATVASMLGWGLGLDYSIRLWRNAARELVRRARGLGDRFLVCRYEDVVADPEAIMRDLLTRLGEPWSDDVLQHHQIHAARGGPLVTDGKTRADEAIDPARAMRWVGHIDDEQREAIRKRTARLSAFFGYSFDDPGRVEPWVASERPRAATGADVERRAVSVPVELEEPPDAPLADRPYDPALLGLRARADGTPRASPPDV